MINKEELKEIEKKLGENILSCILLKKTDCSEIFLINSKENKYIIKKDRNNKDISEEFNNHKIICHIFKTHKKDIHFAIPEVYFLNKNSIFYVMEYINNAKNIQEIIFENNFKRLEKIFQNLGKALYCYHSNLTRFLRYKFSILEHGTIKSILASKYKNKFMREYNQLPKYSYRRILKDFKATNILVDKKNKIYFIDFQKIYYFAPFYYDLARFIDTTKSSTFINSPLYYLLNRRKIKFLFKEFIRNYKEEVDERLLNNARKIHQLEHVYMKRERGQFLNSIILKIIYIFNI